MRIRPATLADAPVIADFNLRLAAETERLQLDPATVAAGVAAVLGDAAKGLYFVAELGGGVVGQLMITYEWSDWRNGNLWWIQSVDVKPEFRNRGVFRGLFAHLHGLARAGRGVAGLRLYMHAENDRARRAYERLGMKPSDYEVFEMDFVLPSQCPPAAARGHAALFRRSRRDWPDCVVAAGGDAGQHTAHEVPSSPRGCTHGRFALSRHVRPDDRRP